MRARPISCCFSGHRPGKLPWGDDEGDRRCLALKERLWNEMEAAYEQGYRHFICGMAQGCDLYFCELALALRQLHGDVTVEAAIPCPSQAEGGRRSSGCGGSGWWRPATMRRWCSSSTAPAVCSGATGTWWITPRC
ncbi:MAG: SLOG family protein [Vescimonas sp.]